MNGTKTRILGVAIRARWLGFAALEDQTHLFDWGMIYYQRKLPAQIKAAKRRIESALSRACPSQIVLIQQSSNSYSGIRSVRSLARALHSWASANGVPIAVLDRTQLRAAFRQYAAHSKHEIATALARRFPQVAWRLPPVRKIWQKEDWRMALFDALAAAWACQ